MRRIASTDRPSRAADPHHFEGSARSRPLLTRDDALPLRVYHVAFDDGAHMRWHRHDGVQLLYGLEGHCLVGGRGSEVLTLEPGDLVVVEAGEEHWHGAPVGCAGAHLAINAGSETTWLEARG